MACRRSCSTCWRRLPELRVIGRTSSFQFKGRNEDLRVIGEKLNVAHILEGSVRQVRREGADHRAAHQAADGSHLWSETYDRTLDDIFVVQDDIAGEVVKALKLTLLGTTSVTHSRARGFAGLQPRLAGAFLPRAAWPEGPRAFRRLLPAVDASAIPTTPRPGRACRRRTRGRPIAVIVPAADGYRTGARGRGEGAGARSPARGRASGDGPDSQRL